MSPYIQTYTGRQFFSLNPQADDVDIVDIAHALSNKCRFAGHCREFYSVAQHSVLVSRELPPEFALWGLMHDAGEAYFADIPKPIKAMNPIFKEIEDKILKVVAEKFGLVWPEPIEIKAADNALLAAEARDLLPIVWEDFEKRWLPLAVSQTIIPLPPPAARQMFLNEWKSLTGNNV